MHTNDIFEFVIFLNNLPKEIHEKIIISIQIFFIVFEIIAFLYIKCKIFKKDNNNRMERCRNGKRN